MKTQQDEITFSNQTPATPFNKLRLSIKKKGNVHGNQKLSRRLLLIKGLSPFLIVSLFLPVLFTYWFIIEKHLVDKFFIGFMFLFGEAYLVYIDLALWKYYEGKRRKYIWLIELVCILLAVALYTFFNRFAKP
jgi:hypothetical protein